MKNKSYFMSFIFLFVSFLPKNNLGDKLFSLFHFYINYGRFPNKKPLLSNYLFKKMNSKESYNPLRAYVSDKEFVKNFIKCKLGQEYLVPTITIIKSYEKALQYKYPPRCCIKPTHLSGRYILRDDNELIDFNLLKKWFETNYYNIGRERNYRYLEPKIIIEPLIFDSKNNEDFKFFCFKGKVSFIQVDLDRQINHTRLYYDTSWKKLDFSILKPKSNLDFKKPKNLQQLINLAEKIGEDFEFIRVDLYTNEKQIFIGEITNWPENGKGYFIPKDSENLASKMIFGNLDKI